MLNSPLGGRRGIGFGLGRSWQRVAAGEDWWLAGGISAANCVAAYQPKGAASYENSKINLANPGTYDATEGETLNWATDKGWWQTNPGDGLITGIVPQENYSIIVRISNFDNTQTGDGAYIFGTQAYNQGYFNLRAHSTNFVYYDYGKWGDQYNYNHVDIGTDFVLAMTYHNAYYNGVLKSTMGTGSIWDTMTANINIFNYLLLKGDWVAGAIYNTLITADQVSAVTTAVQAL